jgi:hypothetical protein
LKEKTVENEVLKKNLLETSTDLTHKNESLAQFKAKNSE